MHVLLLRGTLALALLCLTACATPGSNAPLAASSRTKTQPSQRWQRVDASTGFTFLSVPVNYRTLVSTSSSQAYRLTRENWSSSLKQKGQVQVYIVQTPDFYEVVEQELPRARRDFNTLNEAIACANRLYGDWPIVSMEPLDAL